MPSERSQKRRSQPPKNRQVESNKRRLNVLEDVSGNGNRVGFVKRNTPGRNKCKATKVGDGKTDTRCFELLADPPMPDGTKENSESSLKIVSEQSSGQSKTEVFKTNDYVLILGPSEEKKYVAKILSFYQNQFTDEIHASIKWFYAKHEIPSRIIPDYVHENELFVSVGKNTESVDVESILEKCSVSWLAPGAKVKKNFRQNEFFYRKFYDGKKIGDVSQREINDSPEVSKVEQRNTLLSPKRIRKTPSKFTESEKIKDSPCEPSSVRCRSKKTKQGKSGKILPNSSTLKSPSKETDSQIEEKLMTSPVAASGYGKLEASAVALNILNSDENDDDFGDDMSVSSTSSKSSDVIKVRNSASKSSKKKHSSCKKIKKIAREQEGETEKRMNSKKTSSATPSTLVISIPKSKLQHATVLKLKSHSVAEGVRSSPRRKSVSIVNKPSISLDIHPSSDEDSTGKSECDDDTSESSSDCSYIPTHTPSRSTSRPFTPKSAKRVQMNDKKNTVTPILIKMPRDKLPFIPARPTPIRSAKGKLEKSREKLHVSAIPECLPCRENEFQEIYTFVEGKIRSGGGGCMYVSGVPGTGKTATVREVMKSLRLSVEEGDLSDFTYVDINGMRLTEPRQAYVQLLLQLTNQKATPDHAATLLTKLFSQRRKTSTVVLADELDLLWTKKQDVLYHLFDWPTHRHARLIVVAIANTMDLPERILMNRVASRLGLTRLTFRPYTFRQLQEIVISRLDGLDTFESDAVQLASRKVAAVSGDARRCLDICRRATEIAERKNCKAVGIEHVHSALQEMFATPMIKAICSCSKQEQLFLQAVVAEFRRSGMEEATLGRIVEQHTAISQLEGAAPVSVTTLIKISHRLATNRLILLEGGQRDLFSRIRLNVSIDDVLFSLKQ